MTHCSDNGSAAVAAIDRQRQSIAGWREVLVDARALIGEMAALKGAQAFRRRIDIARQQILSSTCVGDLVVLRNSTAVADMALALAEADRLLPGKAWLFGRGRSRPGEPLYGFAVFETRAGIGDDVPIVMTEHDDPRACVHQAVARLSQ